MFPVFCEVKAKARLVHLWWDLMYQYSVMYTLNHWIQQLLGGLEHLDYFSIQLANVNCIPTDELIFQRGWLKPPTRQSFQIMVL